jgi:diguanylate cyclase (GGDEF)-like protein
VLLILDVRTLGAISSITPFVLAVIMAFYRQGRRTYPGFERWVLANFAFGAGYLLITLRGFIPEFFSIILGNALTVYAEILIFEGIRLFYGWSAFSRTNLLLFLVYFGLHTYFTYPVPNINARTAVISITLLVLLVRSGWILINNPRPELRRTTRGAGIVFLLTGILPLVRAGYALSLPAQINLFMDPYSAWFALFALISLLVWTFYFFLINSARLELDLETARLELVQLAMTDPLTGLPNRRHFFEHAEMEFERVTREQEKLSFLLMDVDGFKLINDSHGHDAGDAVLQHLSAILPGEVRAFDLAARFGGDEFIVMLVNVGREQALEIARRIHEHVTNSPLNFGSHVFNIELSMGIATFDGGDEDLKAVLKRADTALYQAKRDGKNKVYSG